MSKEVPRSRWWQSAHLNVTSTKFFDDLEVASFPALAQPARVCSVVMSPAVRGRRNRGPV
eukprot:1461601-Pyramimonas_sp.AAC.1